MTQIFEQIVADLQAGNYTIVDIRKRSFFTEPSTPITDEAELFEEASKTLLYLYCELIGDLRYKLYYDNLLIPNTEFELPKDTTFEDVLKVISAQTLETMEK